MSQKTFVSQTEAQIKTKRRISPFWLLPFIALMIVGRLIQGSYEDRGNTVTIDFMSVDGIVLGRTPVRYQGVEVGTVQNINLSKDPCKIEVRVSIKSSMKDTLRKDTQFQLITPKASLTRVSGLDASIGGNYIGTMPGTGEAEDHFVTLGTQPKYRLDNGDLMLHLRIPDLGSLNSGSLVYFRKIPMGRAYDYTINLNHQSVTIDVLTERRLTNLVKEGSRSWDVSGVNTDVSFSGAKVELEGLTVLASDTIAFDSSEDSKPATADDTSGLYQDLAHSQCGIIVKPDLPSGSGLKAGSTLLMYRGLEVGQLTELDSNPGGKVTGEMTVDPSVVTLLRDNTRIKLHSPKLSLSDVNLSSLLTGKTFELISGEGEPCNQFVVIPAERSLLHGPDVMTFTPTAPESYGTDADQLLILHDVQAGQVIERTLSNKGVSLTVAVELQHHDLMQGDSKFVVNSRVDVKVGLDGVEPLDASASERLSGGTRILPETEGKMKKSYPLYASLEKVIESSLSNLPTTTVSLNAETLPDVQASSVVLYYKFEVGEVIGIRPYAGAFDTGLHIKPEYRNLLTSNGVFWVEGGAKVQLNGSGLTVQASPLLCVPKGVTSLDNLSGTNASQYKGDKRTLYASETVARAVGDQITLYALDVGKLAVDMSIRYLGIDIDQIQTLELITARNEVQAKVVLYLEYVQTSTRSGTCLSVITPQISAAGAEHLDTILQPYISVEPGRGNSRRDFEPQKATITDPRYFDGLSIVVEAPEAGLLNIGTPVLLRGIEVGAAIGLTLGSLFDHVMVAMRINQRYRHLVRSNSVSWLASSYNLDFGSTDGVVKTGTFDQFICDGIAFATPPGTPLAPKAQIGKHFLLLESEPRGWREWGTALSR